MPLPQRRKRPARFLLILLVYGGIQFYVADKAMRLLGVASWDWVPFLWAAMMLIAPLFFWRLERHTAYRRLAIVGAWVIYGWMGFSFLFFWIGLMLSLYDTLIRLMGHRSWVAPSTFLILAAFSCVIWVFGFVSARRIRVEHISIKSDKFPEGFRGLRIAQISDLHLGVLIGKRQLDRVLKKIQELKPDLLISTGDMVDAQAHFLDGLSTLFASLKLPYGKFAITGNHERYAGLEHALEFHERSGFKLLRGEALDVAGIVLAGVDDPAVTGFPTEEARLLADIPAEKFVIFLKHQPIIDPSARFDLQLSGHTHKGQIFPFGLFVRLAYPVVSGLHALPGGAHIYVSRGTGTWGPPIRIFSPPELTLIELISSNRRADEEYGETNT